MSPTTLGFLAALDGLTFLDNPFAEGVNEFRKWIDGFCHGIGGKHLA